MPRKLFALVCLLTGSLLTAIPAFAAWDLDMPIGVTDLSEMIRGFHHLILIICTVAGVLVFAMIAYCLFAYRRSKGAVAAQFHHNTMAEVIWTIIPTVILILIAIPAARGIVQIEDASNADMTIQVTGYQWQWKYDYLEEGISFYSRLDEASNAAAQLGSGIDPFTVDNYLRDVDNPLVIPVGKKVRLLLTAADVIHAWWVPEIYVKKDAIPGFINEAWMQVNEPGTYRGQCAELCGRGHGFMPVVVVAKTEADYAQWVVQQQANASPTADSGMAGQVASLQTQ